MNVPFTGTCQCGGIHYQVTALPIFTVVCHCLDCQKLSAGAFSLTMLIYREAFHLLRGKLHAWERPTDSGATALCHFCPECSNRIYHENPKLQKIIRLKPGTLDDTRVIRPNAHIWTKRAQSWVMIPSDVQQFETQPDLAQFLKELERSANVEVHSLN